MKKKILFVVPSLSRAGAESQLIDLINGCDSRQYEKFLFVFGGNIDQIKKLQPEEITIYHIPRKKKLDYSVLNRLVKIIDEKAIDIIHCTLNISVFLGWLARRFSSRKPKLVAAVHTTINRSWKEEFWERALYSKMLIRLDAVIFVCEAQAKHWFEKYPKLKGHSHVVHNGVDINHYSESCDTEQKTNIRKQYGIPENYLIISCIAAFRPEKGHIALLDILSNLSVKPYLIIAGDGKLRSVIESRVNELGLESQVKMIGNIADVRPVLEISDLTILASTAVETFSIAMLESMAMGVPVVCSNIGGLSEAVISGETGELVAIGDNEGFVSAIEILLTDPRKRRYMRVKSREMVEIGFSKELMVEKIQHVFQLVLNG